MNELIEIAKNNRCFAEAQTQGSIHGDSYYRDTVVVLFDRHTRISKHEMVQL